MEQLAVTMMVSGYPEDYKRGVTESVVACYQRQVTASDRGEVPLYRPRDWQAQARRRKKLLAKMAWFWPADTVIHVPCTLGGCPGNLCEEGGGGGGRPAGAQGEDAGGGGVALWRSVVTSDRGAS